MHVFDECMSLMKEYKSKCGKYILYREGTHWKLLQAFINFVKYNLNSKQISFSLIIVMITRKWIRRQMLWRTCAITGGRSIRFSEVSCLLVLRCWYCLPLTCFLICTNLLLFKPFSLLCSVLKNGLYLLASVLAAYKLSPKLFFVIFSYVKLNCQAILIT